MWKTRTHTHTNNKWSNDCFPAVEQTRLLFLWLMVSNPFSCIFVAGLNQWIVLHSIRVKLHSEEGAVDCLICFCSMLHCFRLMRLLLSRISFSNTILSFFFYKKSRWIKKEKMTRICSSMKPISPNPATHNWLQRSDFIVIFLRIFNNIFRKLCVVLWGSSTKNRNWSCCHCRHSDSIGPVSSLLGEW